MTTVHYLGWERCNHLGSNLLSKLIKAANPWLDPRWVNMALLLNHVVRTLWHQAQSALGTETSTTPWQQNNKYQALSNVICKPKESKEIADHWFVMSVCHTQQCLCRIQPCRWQTALLLNASWTSGPQHLRFRFLYILACWPFNTPLGFSCSFSPPRVQSTGLNTCK